MHNKFLPIVPGLIVLGIMVNILSSCSHSEPSPPLSPGAELSTFQLSKDLRIELVASEPMVQDPVVIQFDEKGRLWVVEMRGFMLNIDGKGEDDPIGRISILSDQDGDGQMDKSVVFLDSLVMPRALAFVPGGVLVAEKRPLWFVQDLDGDGMADKKTLLDSLYGGRGLPEHSPNGLWRNIDNWYYNAKSVLRYQFGRDHQLIVDSTEFRGQWGISHDDAGRLFYNYNWSQLHADLVPPNTLSRNPNHVSTSGIDHGLTIDRRIYPIRSNPAINRGYIPGTLDENDRLLEFTSACAPLVYRAALLPEEYRGNAFVCEPAGNLIKRNVVRANGPILKAHDPNPGIEFLASTDERFRPVYLANGPDGALYVVDMYRGISQHGIYMTPYLREQTMKRKLDQHIHKGRIWRIVPKDWEYKASRTLADAKIKELVASLSSENGWTRDVAQRWLIEKSDPHSIPLLEELVLNGERKLGRLHALWTLEGMKQVDPGLLLKTVEDSEVIIQTASLRIWESLSARDSGLREEMNVKLQQLLPDATLEMALQIALSAHVLDQVDKLDLLSHIAYKYVNTPLIRDAILSSLANEEYSLFQKLRVRPEWQEGDLNRSIFLEMLAGAVARKRDFQELTNILEQLNRPEAQYSIFDQALLNGLANQAPHLKSNPIPLNSTPPLLVNAPKYTQPIQQKLQLLSLLFYWPGKVEVKQVDSKQALDEKTLKAFSQGRNLYLSGCAGCHGVDGMGLKRFAPPLVDSEWVLGDAKRLALILLHGLEGPIEVNGVPYNAPEILPVMPAHSTMNDGDIANILTYIRNEWGHQASPVSRGFVGKTRVTSQGRVMPWTVDELLEITSEKTDKVQ